MMIRGLALKDEAGVYRLEAEFPVAGMENVAGGPILRQFSCGVLTKGFLGGCG